MCATCGCGGPGVVPVEVHDRILSDNDRVARHNREHFAEHGVLAVNLMGSPGSGKTALLESTARALAGRMRIRAITGDPATHRDAERLDAAGVPSVPITTGTTCHLDAERVHRALHHVPLRGLHYLFIENVGSLVCPAAYDLGQTAGVVALSVTEGEDKPLKYPGMFQKADLVLLTKIDLLPHLEVRVERILDSLSRVMPRPLMFPVSAHTGEGIFRWTQWLAEHRPQSAVLEASRPRPSPPTPGGAP